MLATLYPYVCASLTISAIVWNYLLSKERGTGLVKTIFILSLCLYIPVMLFADGGILYKFFWIFPRDIITMALVVLIANRLIERPTYYFTFMLGLGVVSRFFYWDVLKSTYVFNKGLDENAELLVDLKDKAQFDELQNVLKEFDAEVEWAFPSIRNDDATELDDYCTVNVPNSYASDLDEIIEAIEESGLADHVESNEVYQLSPEEEASIDEVPDFKPGINDPMVGQLWGLEAMGANSYFNMVQGNLSPKKKAKIAILDTGVDSDHEDIKDNYTSTSSKYDSDVQGHGTHCAGIAASVSNNKIGIASLGYSNDFVEVTSIKVLDDNGSGTQQSVINGILKAADEGADVISMSLGGPMDDSKQQAYNDAIRYAQKAGAIVVVAAGNESGDARNHTPSSCDGVIAVSAIDNNLNKASFSNVVSGVEMGIAAPGVNIVSTFPDNKYVSLNGTSMATPYVAGLLGMMKALKPSLTTEEAYAIIKESGKDTDDTEATGKFIQPAKAIEQLLNE